MTIYIASSWKNQHAVEMLTAMLRDRGHDVMSFIENNHDEDPRHPHIQYFEEWCASGAGAKSFEFDTDAATLSELVIYVGPSGTDAWAEIGAAWASRVPIYALRAKGEQAGLMRRMVTRWFDNYRDLLFAIDNGRTN